MIRATFIWLVLIAGLFACIASFKSNGAVDHPLLVQSAAPTQGGPKRSITIAARATMRSWASSAPGCATVAVRS